MRMRAGLCLALGLALGFPAAAQEQAAMGLGAVLRGLDKVTGQVADIAIDNGGSAEFQRLSIEMTQCRYPQGDPAGDAFAYLVIRERGKDAPVFSGWMIASSPALNALDHPRYDIWVMRCRTE